MFVITSFAVVFRVQDSCKQHTSISIKKKLVRKFVSINISNIGSAKLDCLKEMIAQHNSKNCLMISFFNGQIISIKVSPRCIF